MNVTQLSEICIEQGNRWQRHWLTEVDSTGAVHLGEILDESGYHWERWEKLSGKVPSHEIRGMSRTRWYAIRFHDSDAMTLYRADYGQSVAMIVDSSESAYAEFQFMFAEDGGFVLRDSEWAELCRVSDETRESDRLAYQSGRR